MKKPPGETDIFITFFYDVIVKILRYISFLNEFVKLERFRKKSYFSLLLL